MLDWVVVTNYGFAVAGLTVAVLGFLMSLYAPHLQVWDRSYFKLFFLVLAAYVSSNLVGTLSVSMLDARFTSLSRATVFCESLFSSALMPLVTIYLLRCAGELSKRSALLRCVAALWALYLALLILTQYTRYIYYFTPDNVYHRGPLYPVLLVPPILIMCMNLVAFIRRRDRLTRRRQVAFAIVLVLPLTCMLLQMYSYGLFMIVIGTSLASFGLFCFILSDQVQATMAREEEAARQHSALMALQMRPHFIYNVLTSIYYLCAQDPARAQQATLDFTNYLRANFAAVASREPVPFTEELNHTRAYLAVESIRFGDRLQISLDCPHTAFRLPPLTLQPLAENAVKHGVDPELPPLEVHVTTRHEDGASVVTVEDTGPGFDLASTPDTGASALTNLTERLETAGIGFSVLPREGGGTIATIIVPDEEK